MQTKNKNKIINIFTFLIHLALSLFLFGLGYLSRTGLLGRPDPEEVKIGNITIFLSLSILVTSVTMLIKRNMPPYIISILMALLSMISWILMEKSMDMKLFLLIYLIIFTPLSFFKYKLNR